MPRALASVRACVSSRPAVWEINWWDGEARAGQHIFTNQTITSAAGAKDVSPVWLGSVVDGVLSYTMRGNMCGFPMAMGDIVYEWFSFPKNDSFQEFWCVGAVAPIIGPVIMIFCQDPLVKAEVLDAFIAKLKADHGVMITDKLVKVKWPADYKPGDMGEFAFNKPGAPPTIDHAKNAYADAVLAKPYPPPPPPPPPKRPSLVKQLTGGLVG